MHDSRFTVVSYPKCSLCAQCPCSSAMSAAFRSNLCQFAVQWTLVTSVGEKARNIFLEAAVARRVGEKMAHDSAGMIFPPQHCQLYQVMWLFLMNWFYGGA